MRKKGFTLIEILAVIVVLAIIALIATPTILGVIDKAKIGALKNSAHGLIESATLYYAQNGVVETERFELDEENNLSYKGTVEKGTVLINSKGKIMICINEGNNSAYKNYSDTNVVVVTGKTCNVNASETQILLDGENTIDEYTNQELTTYVDDLQNEISDLKLLLQSQNEKVTELYSQLYEKTNDNIELINKLQTQIGTTDISSLGNGTITDGINTMYNDVDNIGKTIEILSSNDTSIARNGTFELSPEVIDIVNSGEYILRIVLSFSSEYASSNVVAVIGTFDIHYTALLNRNKNHGITFRLSKSSETVTFQTFGDYADSCYLSSVRLIRL